MDVTSRGRRLLHFMMVTMVACCILFMGPSSECANRAVGSPPRSAFVGADAGVAIDWEELALPAIVVGPFNDPPSLANSPFAPSFDELVNEHVVIDNEQQWKHIWRRLFHGVPYDADLVDFDSHFVILAGGGLLHPFIGFSITDIESFDGIFAPVNEFGGPTTQAALAVRVVTFLPGPPPPKKDPVWKVTAAAIPREHRASIIVNRQIFAGI